MYAAILLALVLSIAHFFSGIFGKFLKVYHSEILSFSSGFFISFMFLELFPQLTAGVNYTDIFLLVLIGFVIFHISEKYVYQHIKDKNKMLRDLRQLHVIGFFIDHFIVGFILILALELPSMVSLLVFIPLALHTVSSSMSLESIHRVSKTSFNKILLSSSTLIGAIVALLISPFSGLYYGLFALFIGALFYVVIRDILPRRAGGSPLFFILGVGLNFIFVYLIKAL